MFYKLYNLLLLFCNFSIILSKLFFFINKIHFNDKNVNILNFWINNLDKYKQEVKRNNNKNK